MEKAIKRETEPIMEKLQQFLGKAGYQESLLLEEMAKDFFKNKGYEIISADPEIDKKYKTDFIAKNDEVVAVQIKRGQVSRQELYLIFNCATELLHKSYSSYQKKTVLIIANEFPEGFLEIRDKLKGTEGIDLQYLSTSKVSRKLKRAGITK